MSNSEANWHRQEQTFSRMQEQPVIRLITHVTCTYRVTEDAQRIQSEQQRGEGGRSQVQTMRHGWVTVTKILRRAAMAARRREGRARGAGSGRQVFSIHKGHKLSINQGRIYQHWSVSQVRRGRPQKECDAGLEAGGCA
jgi:hypothetical protein